jgi:YVTN family beta-propeller protein
VRVPKQPRGIVVSRDNTVLYAACFDDQRPKGVISVIDIASATVERDIAAGHSCRAPVLSPDGSKLYVCNRFLDRVTVIDVGSGTVIATIPVVRQPYDAALTPDGSRLVVANYLPRGPSNVEVRMAAVSIINTATNSVEANVLLTNGAQSLSGITVSPDGRYAYVSHVRSNFTMSPLFPIEGGWINANAISIVDIENEEFVDVVLLDDPFGGGAANPWGITCNENTLVVLSAGSHDMHVIDRTKMHEELDTVSASHDLSIDLTFSQSFTERKNVMVKGPRCVAMAGSTVYVGGYFSDALEVYDIGTQNIRLDATISLGTAPDMEQDSVRWGEYNFCDASPRICQGSWQSCFSCHPGIRSDALKWDLENDGNGNPKNDKSLLYAHITPPSMWTGVRQYAEVATRKGIELILFIDPASVEPEAAAIDAYLRMQRAVPSPFLDNGRLSAQAQRGREVFDSLGCAYCHPADKYYTDQQKHAGLVGPDDTGKWDGDWDTPTLHEVWRTGPYLHDGRCYDMKKMFQSPVDHGMRGVLSDTDLDALVEFVNSL